MEQIKDAVVQNNVYDYCDDNL